MLNMWCDYEIILLQKRLDIQHENIGEGGGGLKIFLYRSILLHYPDIPYTIPNLISFHEKKYCFF